MNDYQQSHIKAVDDAGIASQVMDFVVRWRSFGGNYLSIPGNNNDEISAIRKRLIDAFSGVDAGFNAALDVSYDFVPVPAETRAHSQIDMAVMALMASVCYSNATDMSNWAWAGEVSPVGDFLPLGSPLSVAFAAREAGVETLVVPATSAGCAAAAGVNTIGIRTARELVDLIDGSVSFPYAQPELSYATDEYMDIQFVKGQVRARRGLEIAMAGGHNMLLIGPPGEGKSLLAKCAGGISPPLTMQESLEVSAIHQAAGKTDQLLHYRPVRMVDPTVTKQALIGGGSRVPYPGEVTLAHRGILFLDEILQCSRGTIEAMRGPMQDGYVTISRVDWRQEFPAQFQLIAAANPCPCGYYGHPERDCVCSKLARDKYMQKLSGPLLDRIPIRVFVKPLSLYEKLNGGAGENSEQVRARVEVARTRQSVRYANTEVRCNNDLNPSNMELVAADHTALAQLEHTVRNLKLSSRGVDNTLKVARTIADLGLSESVRAEHIEEAASFLEWQYDGTIQ